jgi:hypothetical protein
MEGKRKSFPKIWLMFFRATLNSYDEYSRWFTLDIKCIGWNVDRTDKRATQPKNVYKDLNDDMGDVASCTLSKGSK